MPSSIQKKLLFEGKTYTLYLQIALGVVNIYYGFADLMRLKDVFLDCSGNTRDALAIDATS